MSNSITLNSDELINTISHIPEIRALQIELLTFEFDQKKANALHASGIYKSKFKSMPEILIILQEGRALGFNSSEALNGLYFVAGGVQMFGSLKTAYLTKRGFLINFKNEKIQNNMLVETTVEIQKDDQEEPYSCTVTVDQIKGGKNNNGLKNAPFTKLRYEAINRVLKTQLAGIVPDLVSRSEDDYGQAKEVEENQKIKFINKADSLKKLLTVEKALSTDEEKKLYQEKLEELTPKKVDKPIEEPKNSEFIQEALEVTENQELTSEQKKAIEVTTGIAEEQTTLIEFPE